MREAVLSGCRTKPLSGYLKAIAVLRLIPRVSPHLKDAAPLKVESEIGQFSFLMVHRATQVRSWLKAGVHENEDWNLD